MKGKRVLVTGADGFIGSHLVEALIREGAQVRAMTLYNSFSFRGWIDDFPEETLSQIETFAGDVRDPNGLYKAMSDIDIVFHLAALIGIPFSYHSPDSYVDTNVKGTLNVLQAARSHKIERVIHTSTSEVYGTAQQVPISEKHPLNAMSPYAATKIAADQLASSFFAAFDLPVVIVRPFNTYGPRQSARAIIPTIITQVLSGLNSIHLGSLHPTRDFSYVKDTVSGFIAAAKSSSALGQVVNLGSGFEVSMGDAAKIIGECLNTNLNILTDPERVRPGKSEVERLCAETSKARQILPWEPEYASLEGFKKGISETIEWFRKENNLNRYKPKEYNV